MELNNLELLIEVVRKGSFAAVARQRDIDPSSVSRAIAALEDEVGARLLQRTTRRLSLTEAGQLYLRRVEPLVQELARAREEALGATGTPKGTLRLTSSVAFGQLCLVPLLADFRQAYPQLKLELLMSDENLDLVEKRIDLAIRLAPSLETDVIGTRLRKTHYRVVASPAYLDASGPIERPEALSSRDCLCFTLPAFRSRWLFRDPQSSVTEVQVSGTVTMSSALGLRRAAIQGLGPALLADWLIDQEITAGRLIDLFPDYRVTATSFDTGAWLLYPSRAFLPNKVRVAVDFLRQHLGSPRGMDGSGTP